MDQATQKLFNNLASADKNEQYKAFNGIIESTKEVVVWAYEVWDELLEGLTSLSITVDQDVPSFFVIWPLATRKRECSRTFQRFGS